MHYNYVHMYRSHRESKYEELHLQYMYFLLPTSHADFFSDDCIAQVYVMAFTTNTMNSLTTDPPFLELTVAGETEAIQLTTETGREFQRGQGDMWAFDIDDFGFNQECLEADDVEGVALVEGGTDGWHIASIMTLVLDTDGEYLVLTSDIGIDRWIDGNGSQDIRRLELTLN